MTQPAVSIQLKNFQDHFDIPLTELQGRNIQITDFGMDIAAITERALQELQNLEFKTNEYKGVITGKLKIASASTGKYVIPYFLSDFLEEHSGIDLVLDVTNKTRVIESIKSKEVEFAVVSVLPKDMEVEQEALIENRLYLLSKSQETVETKPLIYREPGSATRKEMEAYFKKRKHNKRGHLELTSNEAVKQAVIAGIGSSILPLIGIHNALQNGSMQIIERKDLPVITTWRIIWLKDRRLTPAAEAYLNYIRMNKQQILDKHFGWYLNYHARH